MKTTCEIIVDGTPTIVVKEASGWGDEAKSIQISEFPLKFTVVRDGKPSLSVKVDDTGRIHIVNYEGYYTLPVTHNITLEPTRNWERNEPKE